MRPLFCFAAVLFFALFALAADADTYIIRPLFSDQGYSFVGLDDRGYAWIANYHSELPTYFLYFNGLYEATLVTSFSDLVVLPADFGTPCSPVTPTGGQFLYGVCNNGRYGITAFGNMSAVRPSIYVGPPLQRLQSGGGDSLLYLNQIGDFVWDDQFSDTYFEAVDVDTAPVPEPSSFALLGTALLGFGTVVRLDRRNSSAG